ncbi:MULTISPECIES: ABC transporter ATP-binding protein [Clostridia]|uniref:ATP-binding cassette domain-containing protein n=1 Tax=Clostridia TaxID=186801 RepID=UPI000EA3C495|nr:MULTISPECIES: ABC transporter ATP-binding protein [Clostridia]NBJ70268.1 ABC transporter ATP-binding protein [Roseburia sp. 1XD42-34]RKI76717.1 ABC transporter ATP-binding protein [Clostridium sp. 1xD42-85]
MRALLTITDLEKQLDHLYLGPLDLTIAPGTITTLAGANGAGKSTLFKLIMNLAKRDKGSIQLLDIETNGTDESWKQHIAYQAQMIIGWEPFTGNKLKDFISSLYPHWDEAMFQKMVALFQIPLDQRFGKLSQGVQQKLHLALTLPRNTSLLLLDEPTSFLDIPAKQKLMDLLVEWMEQGDRAIFMASHQSADIMKLSDYIAVLKEGKLIGTFEKDALLHSHRRYWIKKHLPEESIPGVIDRFAHCLISNVPEKTEAFLQQEQITWTQQEVLNLEELLTLLIERR